ncbi:MAG: hypothetical protein WDZ81_00140 [Candidatus Saccharimonadales bacterium]
MNKKDKKTQLDKYRLFYEASPINVTRRGIPVAEKKRPGRKPDTPKLPDNVLDNLEE